jgi:GntR family transcriptional repressor for pyruvate dehydrogenase complex
MREALRVLEAMGLVEIRKGTQGGVFVAEVDMKTTVHGIMNFLHFKTVSVRDITMLRFHDRALGGPPGGPGAQPGGHRPDLPRLLVSMMATGRWSWASREIGFHRYLVRMTGNPMLILIMDFLDNLLRDLKEHSGFASKEFYSSINDSHQRILECMINEDCVGARREMAADSAGGGRSYGPRPWGSRPLTRRCWVSAATPFTKAATARLPAR